METIGAINFITLLSIAFSAFMVYVLGLDFDDNKEERERERKLKEYKKFFNL